MKIWVDQKAGQLRLFVEPLLYLFVWFLSLFLYLQKHHRRCSVREGALENFEKFTRKHFCQSLFLNKVAFGLQLYLRDPDPGVFLRILRNFKEHLFYRTPLDDCFCTLPRWKYARIRLCHNGLPFQVWHASPNVDVSDVET